MIIHGMHGTPEYNAWTGIKERCQNPTSKDFANYGGRGITLCDEWQNFAPFFLHMGRKPTAAHQIDRIDNNKGYEPGNVRWATPSEQQRNRRRSYVWHIKGSVFQTIHEAAAFFGVSAQSVMRWVYGGYNTNRKQVIKKREDCSVAPRYK